MYLIERDLKEPSNLEEFNTNIENMIAGRPFWSIGASEIGKVPTDVSEAMLKKWTGSYTNWPPDRCQDLRFALVESLGDNYETYGNNPHIYCGILGNLHDMFINSSVPHIDSVGDGINGTTRSAIAAYPVGTLFYEGPMRSNIPEPKVGTITNAIQLSGFNFLPLDGQKPKSVTPGAVALLTECTVHMMPPETSEPRWFARQPLYCTNMFTGD